jgi:transaldolase
MDGIKIFSDGAEARTMRILYQQEDIAGFTTNPSLVRKANVGDYRSFCTELLSVIRSKPISFAVLADDLRGIERQAMEIAGWGSNVYVKVPIVTTERESCIPLVSRLLRRGVKVNVTSVMTAAQVTTFVRALETDTSCFLSIVAGRIADTGRDPVPTVRDAVRLLRATPFVELIWASCREPFNVTQAASVGCHIITVTESIRKKWLAHAGHDLEEFSVETVKEQHHDALASGLTL